MVYGKEVVNRGIFLAIYVDSIVRKVGDSRLASFLQGVCRPISILLYADDILLVLLLRHSG